MAVAIDDAGVTGAGRDPALRLARLTRLYNALNTTNEAIMRAATPQALYQAVCDASFHGSRFIATTVFLFDPADGLLKGTASTGALADVSLGFRVSSDAGVPEGRGTIGTAFRTGRPCVANDVLADDRLRYWHDTLRRIGGRATAALPLMKGGERIGVLSYCSSEVGEFDAEMIDLLERVSANASFALDRFEREAERLRAEAATDRAGRLYAALSATNEAIMRVRTAEALFQQVCDAAVEGGKFRLAAVLHPEAQGSWLKIAATAGVAVAVEQMRMARISVDPDVPEGQGSVGIAFRTGKTWTCNDFLNDERTRPWHEMARAGGALSSAAVPFLRDGRVAGVLLFFSHEKDAFDEGIVRLLERLTENVSFALDSFERENHRREAEARAQYLATHDALTGLPNRVMFNELLSQSLQSARRYPREIAVMFIDLDGFKLINDRLGHEAGDVLLQVVATRFRQALRASDVVARLGGDEFVVLLQEISEAQQLGIVARKLLAEACAPVEACGSPCQVSASIGVAMYPRHGDDERSLLTNADKAMYLAKQRGKNNFQFWVPGV